jgi:N-acetylglucosamine kinase-like BadF-type ATPase
MTTYLMGIDGGGSTIRVVIVTPDMTPLTQTQGSLVNPYVIGQEKSAAIIQSQMRKTLAQTDLLPDQISGIGVGVAGAGEAHLQKWLHDVVKELLPQTQIVTSSDMEIALVGANGARQGVLILAGTGSVAMGVNDAGRMVRGGGWGYLLGDEGSGYWLGIQALQAIVRAFDGREEPTTLTSQLLDALDLPTETDILPWLYRNNTPHSHDVARLAPLVIEAAENGDAVAGKIVEAAAQELALLGKTVMRRLESQAPKIAFAGGLLVNPNLLSLRLCELLDLPDIPSPRYPPVIGAALLAKLTIEEGTK